MVKKKSLLSLFLVLVTSTLPLLGCSSSKSKGRAEVTSEITSSESERVCTPDIEQITFGILAAESEGALEEQWTPFLAKMGEALNRQVLPFYTDYSGLITGMGDREIQIAWYGGKAYIEAAEISQAEAFAQTVSHEGYLGYYSHLIMHKDHPLLSKIDLENGDGDRIILEAADELDFAFNDRKSTSGFLVPTYYIFIQNNLEPSNTFKSVKFSGSHEDTALAVADREIDVATNNSEALERLKSSHPQAYEELQVVWTSPIIPGDPIAYRQDLPECLKEEIKEFFYTFTDRDILEPLVWSGFDPAGDRTWNTIRELEIAKEIESVKQDDNLNESDKSARLETLQQRLRQLQ